MSIKDVRDFVVWNATSRDSIRFKPIYVDVAGDFMVGMMLSEIITWYLPGRTGDSDVHKVRHEDKVWIVVKRSDWWEHTRMSVKQADRALSKLVQAGLVEKKPTLFSGAPTTHIRLIEDKFLKELVNKLNNPSKTPFLDKSEEEEY